MIENRMYSAESQKIEIIDDVVFAEPHEIYELRYPNKDIEVTVL